MKSLWFAMVMMAASAAGACGNKSATCVDGASVACACPSGGTGAQVCSGGAYGACTCGGAPAAAAPAPADNKEVADQLAKLAAQVADVRSRVDKAVDEVAHATDEAERNAAKAKLEALQKEQADIQARVIEGTRQLREKSIHISKECLDNPLAKGCS